MAFVVELAEENEWDYPELVRVLRCEHEPEEKTIQGLIQKAVDDGDDLGWIRDMIDFPKHARNP